MIFDKNWYKINEEQLKEKIGNKEIIIFGASLRNPLIYSWISPERVRYIYDNDEKKWGSVIDGIEVCSPKQSTGEVIITAVEDYFNLIPQLDALGFDEIYYFIRESTYETYKAYVEFFRGSTGYDWNLKKEPIKYIHVFTDEKFFLPMVDILEKGFAIQEHAFLIYNINTGNRNNKYGTWQKYKELKEKYHNVAMVEDGCVMPKLLGKTDVLESCIPYIKASEKIIFHGEWMDDKIWSFFCREEMLSQVKRKGIWILWSGSAGRNKENQKYIETLLKFCKVLVDKRIGTTYDGLCKQVDLPKHYLYDNGAVYSWILDKPKQKEQGRNVLIGHSCFQRNNNIETLQLLEKYKGAIDVYCITSYGATSYIEETIQEGYRIFGNRFHAVECFMPYAEYVSLLNTMDVLVCGMESAAAYSNLCILFWLGKKVYLKKGSDVDLMTKDSGLQVYDYYDIPDMDLKALFENDTVKENELLMLDEFDKDKIIERWRGLFELDMENLELT